MKKSVIYILSCFLILVSSYLKAQQAKFGHLSVEEGLSQNTVRSIVQDKNGFMWFATNDGLNRYDGYSFKIFKNESRDSNSIFSNSIRCLYTDNDSMLWIGFTKGTMDCYNPKLNSFTHIHLPVLKGSTKNTSGINFITENNSKQLFIATEEDGIFILNKLTGKWQNLRNDKNNSNSLSSNSVSKLAFDKHGVLWCATPDAGVVSWDPSVSKFTRYTNLNSLFISAIYPDISGKIWVSAWNVGINMIDPVSGKIYSNMDTSCYLYKQLPYALVSNFIENKNGLLWLATAENGVISFNKENGRSIVYKKNPDDQNSISDNLVLSLFEDKSGLIWCGTWQGGLNIFDPKKQLMEHYYHSSNEPGSLINNVVWCISKGKNDKPWIATSEGVCSFDPRTHKFIKLDFNKSDPEAPSTNTIIHAVLEDIDGQIWMGSNGNGLFRYNPKTKSCHHYPYKKNDSSGLSGETVNTLMLDKHNNLWVGIKAGGLNLYQRGQDKFKHYFNMEDDDKSLSSNNIAAFIEAKDGKMWVASTDAGLNLFDPATGSAKHFKHEPKNFNSLSNDQLTSLNMDKSGVLWIGTKSGLCCYTAEKDKFVSYTQKDGLPDYPVNSIENDDAGNLWLSTNKGICFFNPVSGKVKTYDVKDGIQSNEFKVGSSFKTGDGYIYFGGVKGMNRFNPRLMSDNPNAPNLVITGFTVLNAPYKLKEDISFTKEIILSYKDYFFSFEFAGLEFTNTAKNKYKYILEGFNEDWVDIGTAHTVTFTNLDPGKYTLRIKAYNNDGIGSTNAREIRIIITPPFWKTKWFYSVCILIALLCIYSYIKFREKKLKDEKIVLENKVEVRTKELKEEKIKVEEAHKEITDSIHYAKRIQRALLASDILLNKNLQEYFVLYKPKDIVSGDFYWASKIESRFLIAACDCTGHGVPGAFMSLLNISKLNETVNEKRISDPDKILNQVRNEIISALNPEGAQIESKDGMDCVLCSFDFNKMELQFAAANNPLWLIRNNELEEFHPDKMPVGIHYGDQKPFSLQKISLVKGDIIYIFSDGYADQFGGTKGKKFKYQQLKELLSANSDLSMKEQQKILENTIEKWIGNLEQVDDILVVGIRI